MNGYMDRDSILHILIPKDELTKLTIKQLQRLIKELLRESPRATKRGH